jgi:ATP-dependent DNA helicase PIF1
MRTTAGSQEYANWLIELGNGTLPTTANLSSDVVEILPDFLITEENAKSLNITEDDQDPRINALIHHVFGDPKHLLDQDISEEVNSRAILCPKNDNCLKINNAIIKKMPGEQCVYKRIDTITGDEEEVANFPTEFLNTLKISGIPPHTLKLKVGAIIMLLKNIDSRRGLCNGTRLVIKQLRQNVIAAAISSGKNKGLCVFIPRMNMSPTDSDLPLTLNRLQFPVLLAFAVTINKSQGQTFDRVGILSQEPVFSHGQLYVAFSRVTSREGVKVVCIEVQNKAKCSTNLQQYKTGKRFSHIILCIKKFFHQIKEITAQVIGKT